VHAEPTPDDGTVSAGVRFAQRIARPARSVWVQRAVLVAAFAVMAWAAYRRRDDIATALRSIGITGVLGAAAVAGAGLLCQWLTWHRLLSDCGADLARGTTLKIYALSMPAKYLPGGVWTPLVQVEMVARRGVGRRIVLAASATAILVTAVVAAAIGAGAVPAVLGEVGGWIVPTVVVALALAALIHPGVVNRIAGPARTARDGATRALDGRSILIAALAAAASWLCFGVHVMLLTPDGSQLDLLAATCGFALAWLAGFVFILAPAGAGVRDLVLTTILSRYMPVDAAVAVTLLSRAVLTAVDLLIGSAALATLGPLGHAVKRHPA
jgi:hypothetical protein